MGFFQIENRKDLAQQPEKDKGHSSDQQSSEKTFFESFETMGEDRQPVMHVAGKGEREGLSADDHIPAHHEYSQKHQDEGNDGPPDRQAGDQKKAKGDEVSEQILENEYVDEVLFIDDTAQDIPRFYGRIPPKDQIQEFQADGKNHEKEEIAGSDFHLKDFHTPDLFPRGMNIGGSLLRNHEFSDFHGNDVRQHG